MFDFDDINLIPKKCIVDSRSLCDTSIKIGKFDFKLPIIPANMEAVIDEELAIKLSMNNYFYIMHRFNVDAIKFTRKMQCVTYSSISIGISDTDIQLLKNFKNENLSPEYITIDIAHGHSFKMEKMIKLIKDMGFDSYIIAGNVITPNAVYELSEWGADGIKIGIGPGCFIPSAKVLTNNGYKQISEILEGDLVLTHKKRFKKVLQKHEYIEEKSLIQINDLPPSTKKHEYYVINKKDKNVVTEENLNEFAYWIEAQHLNKEIHLLIKF